MKDMYVACTHFQKRRLFRQRQLNHKRMGEDNYGTHCRTIFLLAGLSFNCIHIYITPWAEIKSWQMKSCQISHPCLAQLFWIITTESFEGLLFQLSVIFLQSHFFVPFFQLYFTIFLPTKKCFALTLYFCLL